jgi:hypothetical protein
VKKYRSIHQYSTDRAKQDITCTFIEQHGKTAPLFLNIKHGGGSNENSSSEQKNFMPFFI